MDTFLIILGCFILFVGLILIFVHIAIQYKFNDPYKCPNCGRNLAYVNSPCLGCNLHIDE